MSFAPPCDQFAEIWHGRKSGRPIECGPNMRSADVRDPFLGFRLGCACGLRRKLEHCCSLALTHVRQAHNLPVWKFQRIMMCVRLVLVDVPEDGRRVIDCIHFPAEQPARPTTYRSGEGELRSRKNANCCAGIFWRSEPYSASIEVIGGWSVANFGRP